MSFCLTYFTKHNTLQIHPCCCKWQRFILLWLSNIPSYMLCCSATKSCKILHNWRTPGFPVPHHLPEFAQVHVYWIGEATYTMEGVHCIYIPHFLYPFIPCWIVCFHIWAIVNDVMNTGVHVSFQISGFTLWIYSQEWNCWIKW